MARIWVGTSGFSYSHWGQGIFYPKDLPQSRWFEYYCQYFNAVELNVSFYRLPKKKTFVDWRKRAGRDFVFAVKGSRYITHVKKLKDCQEPLERFFEAVEGLRARASLFSEARAETEGKSKAGTHSLSDPPSHESGSGLDISLTADQSSSKRTPSPPMDIIILWQLPPGLRVNLGRLNEFLAILPKDWHHAFEFRDESWLDEDIFNLLRWHRVAVVFQDFPDWPMTEISTADFIYLRFHGRTQLYSSCYTEKELTGWARKIKLWLKEGRDCYVFFNNDALGYAVENALALKRLIKKQ